MKYPLLKIFAFLFIVFIALCLRPIHNPTPEQCYLVQGELVEIIPHESSKDIGIRIKNDECHYYINRGLERGGLLAALEDLPGKEIQIYPVQHWTPLDPFGSIRHIAHIEVDDEVIYSEYN